MPYLIMLGLAFLGLGWLRGSLGLSWTAFVAIGAALVVLAIVAFIVNAFGADTPTATNPAKPGNAPPLGAGPDLVLAYRDAQGRETLRQVSLLTVTQESLGLLAEFTKLEAWCHTARDRRSFLVPRILSASRSFADPAASDVQALLAEAVAQRPELLRRARAAFDTLEPIAARDCTVLLTEPAPLILTYGGDGREITVMLRELLLDPAGLVVGLRGWNAQTKRVATIFLRLLSAMADGETGELIQTDPQGWLLSKSRPPPANT